MIQIVQKIQSFHQNIFLMTRQKYFIIKNKTQINP